MSSKEYKDQSSQLKPGRRRDTPVLPAVHYTTAVLCTAARFCLSAERAYVRERPPHSDGVVISTWAAGAALCAYWYVHRKLCSIDPVGHSTREFDIPQEMSKLKQWSKNYDSVHHIQSMGLGEIAKVLHVLTTYSDSY